MVFGGEADARPAANPRPTMSGLNSAAPVFVPQGSNGVHNELNACSVVEQATPMVAHMNGPDTPMQPVAPSTHFPMYGTSLVGDMVPLAFGFSAGAPAFFPDHMMGPPHAFLPPNPAMQFPPNVMIDIYAGPPPLPYPPPFPPAPMMVPVPPGAPFVPVPNMPPPPPVPQLQQQLPFPQRSRGQPLDPKLCSKIVQQVEFYLSDKNLPTDAYLLQIVKSNSEGFVPLSVLASFRRIKTLTRDTDVIASALRTSKQLVLSEDGIAVRRATPLPEVDLEEVRRRTVVAENLGANPSIASIQELFSKAGEVAMVRICHPNAANGTQSLAETTRADTVVSNRLHALVEFVREEDAIKATELLTDGNNWRDGMRVRLLVRRKLYRSASETKGKHQRQGSQGADGGAAQEASASVGDDASDVAGASPAGEAMEERDADVPVRARSRGHGRGRGRPPSPGNVLLAAAGETPKPIKGPRMPDGSRGFTLGRGRALVAADAIVASPRGEGASV